VIELREQLITCRAAKEHIDSKSQQQLTLLRDEVMAKEMEWKGVEDMLKKKLSHLQQQNVKLQSLESEMRRESDEQERVSAGMSPAQLSNRVRTLSSQMV